MHIRNLQEADKLDRDVKRWRDMEAAMKQYQPQMLLNGQPLNMTNEEARSVLLRFRSEINKRAACLGIELDDDITLKPF